MPVDSRPVVGDDRPFLLDLYAASRADELSAVGWRPEALRAFLDQQYRAREAGWAVSAPAADDRILVRDGCPIGRLVVDRRADGIRVVDIAVVPEEQGRGIGAALLGDVLAQADAAGLPVTLHVLATSRASLLYERLGFRALAGDGVHVPMERAPIRAPATSSRADAPAVQPNTAT